MWVYHSNSHQNELDIGVSLTNTTFCSFFHTKYSLLGSLDHSHENHTSVSEELGHYDIGSHRSYKIERTSSLQLLLYTRRIRLILNSAQLNFDFTLRVNRVRSSTRKRGWLYSCSASLNLEGFVLEKSDGDIHSRPGHLCASKRRDSWETTGNFSW